jgi:FlgN protein
MSRRTLDELQSVLELLIEEHRRLLGEVDRHRAAIQAIDVPAMEASRGRQEALRAKVAALEARRKMLMDQISAAHRTPGMTLGALAELYPPLRQKLLAQREELHGIVQQISQRSQVAGRVAGAVLGHMNTVVRLLAGAMRQAGVYTKQGVPQTAPRIGVIEAVG